MLLVKQNKCISEILYCSVHLEAIQLHRLIRLLKQREVDGRYKYWTNMPISKGTAESWTWASALNIRNDHIRADYKTPKDYLGFLTAFRAMPF